MQDFSYELAQPLLIVPPSSQYSLLREVGLVFVGDTDLLESVQLRGLDPFDLQSLVLDALANLAAFFQVVKALLLPALRVDADLVPIKIGATCSKKHGYIFKLPLRA